MLGSVLSDVLQREMEAASIIAVIVSRANFGGGSILPMISCMVSSSKVLMPVLVNVSCREFATAMPAWNAAFDSSSTAVPWGDGVSGLLQIVDECSRILGDRQKLTVNINAQDPCGDTALVACIRNCDPSLINDVRRRTQIVASLLSAGADPNIPSHDGATAITLALEKGLAGIAFLLNNYSNCSEGPAPVIWDSTVRFRTMHQRMH